MHQQKKYLSLRQQYRTFHYEGFTVSPSKKAILVTYHFHIADTYHFHPTIRFNTREHLPSSPHKALLENLFFHIGLAEMISYWKITCAPRIIVHPARLDDWQKSWWKDLLFNGLGEFFYRNKITVDPTDFVTIEADGSSSFQATPVENLHGYLVPIGGGKDSAVTLELLKEQGASPFALNPRKAQYDTVRAAGIAEEALITVSRTLDPLILQLNEEGFLNGHTPFSALLAFISLPVALLEGKRHIALSNESSANESTVKQSHVNHQYSKSLAFEEHFRSYVTRYITPDLRYFSMLRPLSELQIGALFSGFTAHHEVFRSCNVGSKTNSWCGACPKCLFTYLVLSLFLPQQQVIHIIGTPMLEHAPMLKITEELAGLWPSKPFECVGTSEEVTLALHHLIRKFDGQELPLVLAQIKEKLPPTPLSLGSYLTKYDNHHHLSKEEFAILNRALHALHP